jgi:hypothetical protein
LLKKVNKMNRSLEFPEAEGRTSSFVGRGKWGRAGNVKSRNMGEHGHLPFRASYLETTAAPSFPQIKIEEKSGK